MPSREPARTPRQVFGGMVRYYREQAGLSRPELARQISKSESLVQAIELGQRAATPQVTGDLETALPAGGALARLREEIGDSLGYQRTRPGSRSGRSLSAKPNACVGSSRRSSLDCLRAPTTHG
jgi:transcriptional regulator with XRE-family HTH domain